MFGNNNDQQQDQSQGQDAPVTTDLTDSVIGAAPIADPAAATPAADPSPPSDTLDLPASMGVPGHDAEPWSPTDDNTNASSEPPSSAPVPDSGDASSPTPAATPASTDDLVGIKQSALQQLAPLVDHLDQTPEEKFRTTMMMIQATDDSSKIKVAYDAAQAITDEKARAQALLDVVNEINYFTQTQNQEHDGQPKES